MYAHTSLHRFFKTQSKACPDSGLLSMATMIRLDVWAAFWDAWAEGAALMLEKNFFEKNTSETSEALKLVTTKFFRA